MKSNIKLAGVIIWTQNFDEMTNFYKEVLGLTPKSLRKNFVNSSSGLRAPYPWRPFWELATEFNVKVICNSDCHNPNDVIAGISENLILADSLGLELADLSYLLTGKNK